MANEIHNRLIEVVAHYTMPKRARELVKTSDLLVICAVTAAGKNTIVNYLIEHDEFAYMVSHTTRQPRENHGKLEQNGRDYWFVDEAKMLELAEQRAFVEIKQVHGTTFYGTSIIAIEQAVQSSRRPITELDVQGAQELMAELPGFRPLFVIPPTYEVWMERLSNRGPISTEERERRFESARMELQLAIGDPRFALVINHDFHETVIEIKKGIDLSAKTQAERRDVARSLLAAINV
jgi:guanylate kinase